MNNSAASNFKLDEQVLVLNLSHLLRMTDDTGFFQHSKYNIPDRNHGYTLDDNARALIVAAQSTDPVLQLRLPVYLGFLSYCQRPDGLFRNFMGYDRHFLEEIGSSDSHGRAMWALGVLYLTQPDYRQLTEAMIALLLPHLEKFTYLRTKAFIILGLQAYLEANPYNRVARALLEKLAAELEDCWQINSDNTSWNWFEDRLTYENARLPQAMFAAYLITGQARFLKTAQKATAFLESIHFSSGYLKLVGNEGWLQRGKPMAEFDEQPVDAGALVELFCEAYRVTGNTTYVESAQRAFEWYLGRNCHNLAMINPASGGCYDALTEEGVNFNQGAESIVSFQMAQQRLQQVIDTPRTA